jgi:integrase
MAKDQLNFTKANLDRLPSAEPGKRKYWYDTHTRSLTVCVTDTGRKTFYLYRWAHGKPQRVRIGLYPEVTIEQARKRAIEENAAIASGHDPSVDRAKKRAEWTFGDLFDWYLEHHAKIRKRSWERDQQNYNNHLSVPLGGLLLSRVTRTVIRETHVAVWKNAGPYAANRLLALISVVFSKAIADQLIPEPNPAKGIENFPEQSRKRRLYDAEMPRLLAALNAEPNEKLRDFIYILLATGARRGNVLAMRWDQIDFRNRVWEIPLTKNGTSQTVPLEDFELEVLKRRHSESDGHPFVFPGRSDSKSGHMEKPDAGWKNLLERAEIEGLRLHDLRRTLGSWMVDTGASLPVVGGALHHKSQETTAIYARLSHDPVRKAKARAMKAMLATAVESAKAEEMEGKSDG